MRTPQVCRSFLVTSLAATLPHLNVMEEGADEASVVAYNLEQQLSAAFGVPFLAEQTTDTDSRRLTVSWRDGPCEIQVHGFCHRHTLADPYSAAPQDRHRLSVWQHAFGAVHSIEMIRGYSDEAIGAVIGMLCQAYGPAMRGLNPTPKAWRKGLLRGQGRFRAGPREVDASTLIRIQAMSMSWGDLPF